MLAPRKAKKSKSRIKPAKVPGSKVSKFQGLWQCSKLFQLLNLGTQEPWNFGTGNPGTFMFGLWNLLKVCQILFSLSCYFSLIIFYF